MIAFAAVLSSCNDYETYGDKKEKERNAIAKFISDSSIVVITEDQFNQQGYTTNLSRNEFVKLDKSGVYMQIVREGCGDMIKDGLWLSPILSRCRAAAVRSLLRSRVVSCTLYMVARQYRQAGWCHCRTSRWAVHSLRPTIVQKFVLLCLTHRGMPQHQAMLLHAIMNSHINENHND